MQVQICRTVNSPQIFFFNPKQEMDLGQKGQFSQPVGPRLATGCEILDSSSLLGTGQALEW
jgi:hypothetical protein